MIPRWLIHPFRAFREDLATNPVTRMTWGIEPKSRDWIRKRRALISTFIFGYLVIWVLILLAAVVWVTRHMGFVTDGHVSEYEAFHLALTMYELSAMHLWAFLVIVLSPLRTYLPGRGILEELKLTTVPIRRIPFSFVSFRLTCIFLMLFISCGIQSCLWFHQVEVLGASISYNTPMVVLYWISCMAPFVACTLGLVTLVCSWVRNTKPLMVWLNCLLVGILLSPEMLWHAARAIETLDFVCSAQETLFPLANRRIITASLEAISWPIRIAIVVWLWREAIRKLEGE